MEVYGKVAFQGIAIGKICEFKTKENNVRRYKIDNSNKEWDRFEEARSKAIEELGILFQKAKKEVGEDNAAIFEIHQMMLEDDDYLDSIKNMIVNQLVNAEYAVAITGENFENMFSSMDDAYMKERAADVKDISERLIRVLNNTGKEKKKINEPVIIVADDLSPSKTVQLDRNMVLGFITRQGATNSHTAILARTMNIPAIVQTQIPKDLDGRLAIIDGSTGKVIIDPEESVLVEYEQKQLKEKEMRDLLLKLRGKQTITKSGKKIKLYANIGDTKDVNAVLQNDAEGIGLFRSEFIYLQSDHYPSEDEQLKTYKEVAENMAGKKVIIRTMDIGADKKIGYFNLCEEENPALGYRAIRICLNRPELFRTQLRAIYRASAYGNIAIMIPMIISVWEVKEVKRIIEEVKAELLNQGFVIGDVEFGIMIETPAAVMVSDELAKEVDFFSIGSNDLTQYTLAIDRQNCHMDQFYDSHHPAILRMIQIVIDNAHKNGIWAGICGELGADLTLIDQFMEMGVDELSVSPTMILQVRNCILNS